MTKAQDSSQKTLRASGSQEQTSDLRTSISGKKEKKSGRSGGSGKFLSVKLRRSRREIPVSEAKRERTFPTFLTEQEIEEAKCYLGIFLPSRLQRRYEKIYRQKVEARRIELETDEWKRTKFPK